VEQKNDKSDSWNPWKLRLFWRREIEGLIHSTEVCFYSNPLNRSWKVKYYLFVRLEANSNIFSFFCYQVHFFQFLVGLGCEPKTHVYDDLLCHSIRGLPQQKVGKRRLNCAKFDNGWHLSSLTVIQRPDGGNS
jgi:hypothetical protein